MIDRALAGERLGEASGRFAALLRTAPDAQQRVRGLDWTVSELGRHVLGGLRGRAAMARGGPPQWPDLLDGAAHNARQVAAQPEIEPMAIADAIDTQLSDTLEAFRTMDEPFHWEGGVDVPVAVSVAGHLGDTLVHGFDLARTLRTRWTIDPADARLALAANNHLISHLVNHEAAAGKRLTLRLHLRAGESYLLRLAEGEFVVRELAAGERPKADAVITAEPVAFLLQGINRMSPLSAALRGKVRVTGRRPWVALQLRKLVRIP